MNTFGVLLGILKLVRETDELQEETVHVFNVVSEIAKSVGQTKANTRRNLAVFAVSFPEGMLLTRSQVSRLGRELLGSQFVLGVGENSTDALVNFLRRLTRSSITISKEGYDRYRMRFIDLEPAT